MCIIAQVYFRLEKDLIFFIFDFRIDRIRLMYSFLFLFLFFFPIKGKFKKNILLQRNVIVGFYWEENREI